MIPVNIYINIDQGLMVSTFNMLFNLVLIFVFWFGVGLNEMKLSLDETTLTFQAGAQSREIMISDIDADRSYLKNGELRLYKISSPHHDPIQIYPASIKNSELKQKVIDLLLVRSLPNGVSQNIDLKKFGSIFLLTML